MLRDSDPKPILPTSRDVTENWLDDVAGALGPEVASRLSALQASVSTPHAQRLVHLTGELAALVSQVSRLETPTSEIGAHTSDEEAEHIYENYGRKVDEARDTARLTAEAAEIFGELLRSHDSSLMQVALLVMDRYLAKSLKRDLTDLSEEETMSDPIRRRAISLISDGTT